VLDCESTASPVMFVFVFVCKCVGMYAVVSIVGRADFFYGTGPMLTTCQGERRINFFKMVLYSM